MTAISPDPLRRVEVVAGEYADFLLPRGDLLAIQTAEYGSHTRPELAMVLDQVGSGWTIIDVGAHVGTFAIPFARRVGPTGRVVAVEPYEPSARLLEINAALNLVHNTVDVVQAALGRREGTAVLRASGHRNTGATYAEPLADGAALPEDAAISTMTLDALTTGMGLDRVDLVKIDVEGMEFDVLMGGAETIQRWTPLLYLEVASSQLERASATTREMESLLRSWGYRFYRNVGERNAPHDRYEIVQAATLETDEQLFDVMCIAGDGPTPT